MRKETNLILFSVLLSVFLAISSATAATVSLSEESVPVGGETTLILSLDEAPDGFAGYFVSMAVDPEYVRIVNVEYPEWATMQKTIDIEEGSDIRLKTVDLMKTVGLGAKNIELARITLSGIKEGYSKISFYDGIFSDDSDNEINPVLPDTTIIVGNYPIEAVPDLSSSESGNAGSSGLQEGGEAGPVTGNLSSIPVFYFVVIAAIICIIAVVIVVILKRREVPEMKC